MAGDHYGHERIDESKPEETGCRGGRTREDWWGQDRVDAVGWGLFFIWAALVLAAEITGYTAGFSWQNGWAVVLIGGGLIAFAATLFRLVVAEYRRKWAESLIWGLVLVAVGSSLGGWTSWGWIWVLVLAVIGLKIVARAFARRR